MIAEWFRVGLGRVLATEQADTQTHVTRVGVPGSAIKRSHARKAGKAARAARRVDAVNRRVWAIAALILAAALIGVGTGWVTSGGLLQITMQSGIGEG